MAVCSLRLVRWHDLTPLQQDQVRGLEIPPSQIEFAGSIERAVISAEAADGESAVGLAVVDGERPLGFLLLGRGARRPEWAPEGMVALTAMRIDHRHQGRGIGRAALGLVDHWVLGHWPGSRGMVLSVDDENQAGRQAYAQAGYTEFDAPRSGRIGIVRYLTKPLPVAGGSPAALHSHPASPAAQVTLVAHQPTWAGLFADEAARLAALFGDPGARVEHIGSTAVPGLCAKPVIDVLLGTPHLSQVEAAIPALERLGYRYRPEHEAQIPQRRYFARESPVGLRIHLHAVVTGERLWREHLAFRDALRARPALRAQYAALKLRLAERHAGDKAAYTRAKAPFITQVLAALGATPV